MVNRKIPRILIICAALAALVTTIGYVSLTRVLPALLERNMEEILSWYAGREVSVARSSVKVLPRVEIILDELRAGAPDTPLLSARRVEARAPFRDLVLKGGRSLSLELDEPILTLDLKALKRLDDFTPGRGLPSILIHNGSIVLPGEGRPVILSAHGMLGHGSLELTAEVLGARAEASVRIDTGLTGTIACQGMDLSLLDARMQGVLDLAGDFSSSGREAVSHVDLQGNGVVLPWSRTRIETLHLAIGARGGAERIEIREISLKTPLAEVSGTGRIEEPGSRTRAPVVLDLSSNAFEYERIVDLLPVDRFRPWLRTLLSSQIRGGLSRFASAHYEGTLGELLGFTRFIDHITVTQELMGQRFRFGPGTETITDITGQVVYGNGHIVFRDLSGRTNGSVVEKVNLHFHDVLVPGVKVGVDVKLDMPARDFLDTWKASGLPVYSRRDLLAGISGVEGGRVRGEVSTLFDSKARRRLTAKGEVALENCSYLWGSHRIRNHSGYAAAADFSAPVRISSNLDLPRCRVQALDITLQSPFDEPSSTFRTELEGGFILGGLSLDKNTVLMVEGASEGGRFSAEVNARSGGFVLAGSPLRFRGGPAEAHAGITGTLRPERSLEFSGRILPAEALPLEVRGSAGEAEGRVRIRGLLDLARIEAVMGKTGRPLSGEIQGEAEIEWGRQTTLEGSLTFKQAVLPFGGEFVTVDGPLRMEGSTMQSEGMRIRRQDTEIGLSRGVLSLTPEPSFRGDLAITGLDLSREPGRKPPKGLRSWKASGRIKLLDANIYGIPLEETGMGYSLEQGVLSLTDLRSSGKTGTVQGFLTTDLSRIRSFDLRFSLFNVNIKGLFDAFSQRQDLIRGTMDFNGRLRGENGLVNGTVNLVAKKGRLKKYALSTRIFALLNVYKIIQSQELELTSKNFPYNTIAGTFQIEDSVMHFDDFYLDSNSLQLSAVGKYSLITREIDAVLGVQPFETIDKVISWIPLVGWVLTGENGRLLVVSLNVTGQIDDPTVQVAPIETISSPILESLGRTLNLPFDIVRDWRRYVPGIKK
ncbi:MAG: AsmA-like C-terminal domain-containing protein [Desulfomonilia bacterium]|jgi:hypothetical protein